MSGPQSFVTITLSAEQQAVLEALQRQATCSQALALRVRIVLGIAAEQRVGPLATLLGCSRFTIRIWRNRWVGAESQLAAAEADWCVLRQMGVSVLADAPRSGTPATFSAEQIVQIIISPVPLRALPVVPSTLGHRANLLTKPNARALSAAFLRLRSDVFWGEAELQPHRSRYWLNAKTKVSDPQAFAEQVETVCRLYAYAPLLHQMGGQVVSCDELTAIQALEQIAPTQPMQAGQVERREFEYIRHAISANCECGQG